MLTKTQVEIMKVFVSKINDNFSIKQVSEIIAKPYPLVHRSIKLLIEEEFLIKDKRGLISLNYRNNFQELAYIEGIRKNIFLLKNKTLSLFCKDITDKLKSYFFIMVLFGSSVEKKDFKDIDILIITEDNKKIQEIEKFADNIASNFSLKFDINAISIESAYEMLAKRDKLNVMNETLNNHLILFGAENYYMILKNAR